MRLAAVLLVLVLPGTAMAAHEGPPRIDHYIRAQGDGRLLASSPGHDVAWERCAPSGSCSRHDDGDGVAYTMHASSDPAGTVFQVTQDGATARSEPWRGVVRAVEPPRADGAFRVGEHVVPVAARWEGGWGRESDWLQLQACEGADGTACKVIVDPIKFGRCPPGTGRYLPARYEGWWLKVADARIDRAQPFTREGYFRPEGVRPLDGTPGTATAVLGQIGPGTPPAEDCGSDPPIVRPPQRVVPPVISDPAPPSARLRAVIRRDARGRIAVADVLCGRTCVAELRLRQGRRVVRVRRTLRAGTTTIALPRAQARRLRRGAASLRVTVARREIAARRVRLAI